MRMLKASRYRSAIVATVVVLVVVIPMSAASYTPQKLAAPGPEDTIFGLCAGDYYDLYGLGGDLNCTANDIVVAQTYVTELEPCSFPGDVATVHLTVNLELHADARHDIGLYLATDGGDAHSGSCYVSNLPHTPDPPYLDLDGTHDTGSRCGGDPDGEPCTRDEQCQAPETCDPVGPGIEDTCGDIRSTNSPLLGHVVGEITFTCQDEDADGNADLASLISWRQPGQNELCTQPFHAFPGSPPKCKSQTLQLPIEVPGEILVEKVTVPAGAPDLFDFSLTGGPDSVNDSFVLSDGQSYSSAEAGLIVRPGTYSLVETPTGGWIPYSATCDDGSDPSAIDVQPGETVACTFENHAPTSVELLWFLARGWIRSVVLGWETASEVDNLGFNLYRTQRGAGGQWTKLNDELIPSQVPPGSPFGAIYRFWDTGVEAGIVYFYRLEEVDIYGWSTLHGPVMARGWFW